MQHDPSNPFREKAPPGYPVEYVETYNGQDRIDKVRTFNAEQLRQAIALPGVQKSVKQAAERRLRKLEGA